MSLVFFIVFTFAFNINLITKNVDGARILCVFPIPSRSHTMAYTPLVEELAKRGHDLVVITPDPVKNYGPEYKNITQIDVSFLYQFKGTTIMHSNKSILQKLLMMKTILRRVLQDGIESILEATEVQNLINDQNDRFDAILMEFYASGPLYAFSHRFKAPMIGITSGQPFSMALDAIGNPDHPIENPDVLLPLYKDLTLKERLISVGYALVVRAAYYQIVLPLQDELAKKYFGEDTPYIGDLEKDIQLLILNFHAVLGHTRPKVPSVIYTGSMHIRPSKPLPEDLKNYLDNASAGVIYFSLGSNVKSSDMNDAKLGVFLSAFKELPYKVLWKWETEIMTGKPENVKLSKWLPQQDLLGHPNIKVFITQGGQQSMEEAIANAIPLLGLPFMADQHRNVKKFVEFGIGETLDFETLTKEELITNLKKLAENSEYKNNQIKLRELINDEPMTSLERGCWWIEHVIRHKGARHLRSSYLDIPLYQFLFLDIIAFFIVISVVLGYINYKLFTYLLRKCCNSRVISEKKKTN